MATLTRTPDADTDTDVKVLTEPSIYLLARQQMPAGELDRFLAAEGVSWQSDSEVAAEVVTETAGRTCYLSFAKPRPGGNAAYLHHIKEVGHGSVLEHAVWSFLITGVSRTLTHELVRHRAGWSYCLAGDTRVHFQGEDDADETIRLDELHALAQTSEGRSRLDFLPIRCLDEAGGHLTTGYARAVAASGRKPVYRVRLDGGQSVTASKDHRFLTPAGWMRLEDAIGGLSVDIVGQSVHGPLDVPLAVADPAPPERGGGTAVAVRVAVRFARVLAVTYVGVQETFDLEMEGPHANFVANGVVTHNSQLSQRYVDESVAEYVEPDVIAADPELHAIWLDAVSHAHAAYVSLAERLNAKLTPTEHETPADRTARRKTARQAARSVLPNATETKITVTVNARALRHFLESRGSRHAEPEIRKLANRMLDLLVTESPHLFGDYRRETLPDGTQEITTAYPKV